MCQTTATITLTKTKTYSAPKYSPDYDRDDIFAAKNSAVQLDIWSKLEYKMINTAVTFIEFTILLFATTRALFSIINPKIQHGLYSLFILVPLSILLPAFFNRVDAAKEDTLDD